MGSSRDAFAEAIIVRLFRTWSASCLSGCPELPRMHMIARCLNLPVETAPACASLFELVEAHLGRELRAGCLGNSHLSVDEKALLRLIQIAGSLEPASADERVPHGLSGAIHWAALVVRRCFGLPLQELPTAGRVPGACPFVPAQPGGPALGL